MRDKFLQGTSSRRRLGEVEFVERKDTIERAESDGNTSLTETGRTNRSIDGRVARIGDHERDEENR